MGQADVLEVLKKENRWMSNKDIAKETGHNISSTTKSTARLYLTNFVEIRHIPNKRAGHFEYKVKDEQKEMR